MATSTEERRQRRIAGAARKAEEREQRRRERQALWAETGAYLTWEELCAGEPCRGCGRPIIGDGTWESVPLNAETPEQRRVRLDEDRRYRKLHGDCRGYRTSMQGSPVQHCGECCPPFPMSPATIEEVRKIFANAGHNPNLMKWTLTLSCGHANSREADQHHTYLPASGDWSPVYACSTCGEHRAIILAEKIGPVSRPAPSDAIKAGPSQASLKRKIRAAEKQLAALRAQLDSAGRDS